MNTFVKISSTLLLGLLLAACEGNIKDEQTDAAPVTDAGASTSSTDTGTAITTGANELGMINGIPIDNEGSPAYVRTVYFEYDSSEVRSEFIPVIAAHGELLASNSGRVVVLEGHADERGSREYNIALGERRALSVRRLLLGSGARDNQVRTVSYGEERPVEIGHNESAWSKNRRVEIRYE